MIQEMIFLKIIYILERIKGSEYLHILENYFKRIISNINKENRSFKWKFRMEITKPNLDALQSSLDGHKTIISSQYLSSGE